MRKSTLNNDPFAIYPSLTRQGISKKNRTYDRPEAPSLDLQKTISWIEHVSRDEWWKSQMPVSIRALGLTVGTAREDLYIVITKSVPLLKKIAQVIPHIEARIICFPEIKRGKAKFGERKEPYFIQVPEPAYRMEINRLAEEREWSLWCYCRSCKDNKFLPIVMNDKPHVACYRCIPPSQYRTIGATAVKKSLIHQVLKNYY